MHHLAPKQASSIRNVKFLKVCGKGKIRPSFRDQSECICYVTTPTIRFLDILFGFDR